MDDHGGTDALYPSYPVDRIIQNLIQMDVPIRLWCLIFTLQIIGTLPHQIECGVFT